MHRKDIFSTCSKLIKHFGKSYLRYRNIILPLRSEDDWNRVPIVTRDDMVLDSGAVDIRGAYNVTATSGTTASRLLIAHSRACYWTHLRRLADLYKDAGIASKDLCLNLCSYSLNSGGRLMEAAYRAAGAGVIPLGVLDSATKLHEAVSLVDRLRPTVVNSYTNQLFDLFSIVKRKHSIKKCIVNGEPLSKIFKKQIEDMGGVQIHDHYGAMEVSGFAIAQKYNDEYMKIFDEGLYIEVQHDDGDIAQTGQGAIIVTDLVNRAMPFIRYRLGDRVEVRESKGRKYIKVLGRLSDSVLLDGQTCSREELTMAVKDVLLHPNFFMIIEKDAVTYKDLLIINVQSADMNLAEAIRKAFRRFLDLGMRLSIKPYSGVIPKTTSGKFRHIIDARNERTK